jgi:putative MATE family efflux protein
MEDKRIKLFRDEKISTAINKLSLPAVVGLIVLAIYNFVDTMFVAWLGTAEAGAATLVMPVMMIVQAFGAAVGHGSASYVSRLLGMNRKHDADKVATVSIYSMAIASIVITLVTLLYMEPILRFFGGQGKILELAKSYCSFILLGTIFALLNMTMNNLLRSEGSAVISMTGMIIGSLINIILDPIFIFVLDLGISGAAIATTLSRSITTIILLSRYMARKSLLHIGLKNFKPSLYVYREIFRVGIPTLFKQLFASISFGLLSSAAFSYGGQTLLAAVGILFRIVIMPMYAVFGIGQAFQPVAGYNYGAGNKERVMAALRYAMVLSSSVTIGSVLLMNLFSSQLFGIFRAAEDVAAYGIMGLKYYSIAMVLMSINNTIATFYQALGKGRESMILSIARQGFFFIPVILIVPSLLGVQGILATQLISDILTMILSACMFVPYIRSDRLDMEMTAMKARG